MVARLTLRCNHCQKTILLRLAVGHEEKQTFFFECENCAQGIQGVLMLTKEGDDFVSFEMTGATQITPAQNDDIFAKTTDYVITIDPDFAYSDASREDAILTPFLQASMRNRDDFMERLRRSAFLDKVVKEGSSDITRIIRNYVTGNWVQFEVGVKGYIPKEQPVTLPIDRNRALYQLLELFLSPVVTSRAHADLILSFTTYIATIVSTNPVQFDDFVTAVENAEYLQDVQHGALDLVPRFLNLAGEFRPIIMEWDFENPDQDLAGNLKVKPKANFHDIKSFYVDTYELVCRSLTLITGLINIGSF